MATLKQTDEFGKWLKGLDVGTRAKVLVRMDRLRQGNPGDVAPVGEGISEMRIPDIGSTTNSRETSQFFFLAATRIRKRRT
jgi:putative addiction module killer protein